MSAVSDVPEDLYNPTALPTAPPDASHRRPALAYDGRGREVFGLVIGNAFLGLVTLGLNRFWARTRYRRYLWNHVSFAGDRLEYMGRPDELMVGLFATGAIFVPVFVALGLAIDLLSFSAPPFAPLYQAGAFVLIFILGQLAAFRARRFRLSRTTWRGLRFHQDGSAFGYMLRWLGWTVLAIATAGLTLPFRNKSLYRYRMRHTWVGDQQLTYDDDSGSPWRLMPRWFLCWLLLGPTLFMSYAWYRAAELRHIVARTRLGTVAPTVVISGWRVLKIYFWPVVLAIVLVIGVSVLANWLLIYFIGADTFGYGLADRSKIPPWVQPLLQAVLVLLVLGIVQQFLLHRELRAIGEALSLEGRLDAAVIRQSPVRPRRFGEGLADALDVGGL
ncbi:MAG: DUF898 domain-containing protein [Alphaproteobacteria bacterium]|nr:DUF898 domain-containing protein [Alphaproteobacteria bacterium]